MLFTWTGEAIRSQQSAGKPAHSKRAAPTVRLANAKRLECGGSPPLSSSKRRQAGALQTRCADSAPCQREALGVRWLATAFMSQVLSQCRSFMRVSCNQQPAQASHVV